MKLERYKDKKETRRKVILIGLTMLTLVSITMMLYKTFAKFTTTANFQIMSGKVKYKKKNFDFGEGIPTVEEGDGLYKVEHSTSSTGWNQVEYRYAGKNVNNYVTFNSELWRIIGLVNVKISGGQVGQRIKIIKNTSIGTYSWSEKEGYECVYWKDASLQKMLNGIYYNRTSGTCRDGISQKTFSCDFSSTGLNSQARGLIENVTSWGTTLSTKYYTSYSSETFYNIQTNSVASGYVGLMDPSDYLFATGDDQRDACLKAAYGSYSTSCKSNNWLNNSEEEWTQCLNPIFCGSEGNEPDTWEILSDGTLYPQGRSLQRWHVRPVVFLASSVKIIDGEGTTISPYILSES